jgi:hypothetical protein
MFLVKCQLAPEMVNRTCKYYILRVPRCYLNNVFAKVKGRFSSFCCLYSLEIFFFPALKKTKLKRIIKRICIVCNLYQNGMRVFINIRS